jgi:uncharacterized protein DUF4279
MASSVACHFTVTGDDFDPDDFTRRVGLTPTDRWRVGDIVGESVIHRKHSGWRCSLPRRSSLDVGDRIRTLLTELLPFADAIRQECKRSHLKAEISCVIFVGTPAPAAHFDSEILAGAARLGAEIDLDLYIDEAAITGG